MADDPVEGMARVGWACIFEMIDDHREQAAKTDDAELAAMLLKDAAVYEADVLKRARAAWAYALTAMRAWEWTELPDEEFLDAFAAGHRLEPAAPQGCASAPEVPLWLPEPRSAASGAVRGAVGPSATTALLAAVPATDEDAP